MGDNLKKNFSFLGFLFIVNFIIISVIVSSPVYADVPEVVNVIQSDFIICLYRQLIFGRQAAHPSFPVNGAVVDDVLMHGGQAQ